MRFFLLIVFIIYIININTEDSEINIPTNEMVFNIEKQMTRYSKIYNILKKQKTHLNSEIPLSLSNAQTFEEFENDLINRGQITKEKIFRSRNLVPTLKNKNDSIYFSFELIRHKELFNNICKKIKSNNYTCNIELKTITFELKK